MADNKKIKSSQFAPFAFTLAGLVVAFALLLAGAFLRSYKLRKLRTRFDAANSSLERDIQLNRAEARELIENPDYLAWVAESELGMNQADEVALLLPGGGAKFRIPVRPRRGSVEDRIALLAAPLVYDKRVRYTGLALVFTCFAAAVVGRAAPSRITPRNP